MIKERRNRLGIIALVAALALVGALVVGCGQKSVKSGPTAMGSLETARSALSTMAPDAKLLVVQTPQAVTPTSTPVWAYLFGSKAGNTYIVYMTNGKIMGAQQYGSPPTSGFSESDWSQVPATDSWKIDSDAAYKKALAASGAKGDPVAYMMGFLTYKPKTDTSTIEPFVWMVEFDPGKSGATTSTVQVNAKTGDTSIAKPPAK